MAIANAYIVDYVPEEAEDIYVVMATPDEVLVIEVPRLEGPALVERKPLSEYLERKTKASRRRLEMARSLIRS